MKIWVGRTLHKIFGYSEVIIHNAECSSHQSQICRLETRHIALLCVVTVTPTKHLISNIFPLYGPDEIDPADDPDNLYSMESELGDMEQGEVDSKVAKELLVVPDFIKESKAYRKSVIKQLEIPTFGTFSKITFHDTL